MLALNSQREITFSECLSASVWVCCLLDEVNVLTFDARRTDEPTRDNLEFKSLWKQYTNVYIWSEALPTLEIEKENLVGGNGEACTHSHTRKKIYFKTCSHVFGYDWEKENIKWKKRKDENRWWRTWDVWQHRLHEITNQFQNVCCCLANTDVYMRSLFFQVFSFPMPFRN